MWLLFIHELRLYLQRRKMPSEVREHPPSSRSHDYRVMVHCITAKLTTNFIDPLMRPRAGRVRHGKPGLSESNGLPARAGNRGVLSVALPLTMHR